jgi:predicted RNase H-like HicB family nuclease
MAMASTFTAVIRQDGPWWLGWVEEVPGVNAQERSRDKLLESLRQVLREALEFNRIEALEAAGPGSEDLALNLANAGIGFAIATTTAANF